MIDLAYKLNCTAHLLQDKVMQKKRVFTSQCLCILMERLYFREKKKKEVQESNDFTIKFQSESKSIRQKGKTWVGSVVVGKGRGF